MPKENKSVQHTTGPWKAIPYGETIAIRSMAKDGWDIVTINPSGNANSGIPNKQNRANGRMIAAAPTMLSALELAEGWIDSKREDENTGEGQQARWILDTIRAAIGEASPGKEK